MAARLQLHDKFQCTAAQRQPARRSAALPQPQAKPHALRQHALLHTIVSADRIVCRSKQSRPAAGAPESAVDVSVAAKGRCDAELQSASELAAPDNAAKEVLWERQLDIGRLTVGRMAPEELGAAAVIVTRAFAGTPEAQSLGDIREYIETLAENPAESLVLVARLQPNDGAGVPEGAAARVAGVAMLSFVPETREAFPSLQPPDDAAYLSNTAVDPAFRRKGVARALLTACEDACRAAGQATLTLHARLADDAGRALYSSSGFTDLELDPAGWTPWRRYRPRALMAKQL